MGEEDGVWRALAKSHRRAILQLVRDEERSAGDIAATFDITRPAVSQHLGALKDAGLLSERRDGTKRLYRARRAGLDEVSRWLRQMQALGTPAPAAPRARAAARERAPRKPERYEERVALDLRPGAAWRLLAEPAMRARWKGAPEPEVLEVERGVRIRWRWRFPGSDAPAEVEVRLVPEGRVCELVLSHQGAGASHWPRYLERLQAVGRGWDPGPEEEA